MSQFIEHVVDFEELQIKQNENLQNENIKNDGSNAIEDFKSAITNSIQCLDVIQQENLKNNNNNNQEQKIDDNASVMSSSNSVAFTGNFKNIRLPYIINSNDFEHDNYIGLSKFFNDQPKDIIGNDLNEQEEGEEIIVGVILGSERYKQVPNVKNIQNSQNPQNSISNQPQNNNSQPQSNIPQPPSNPSSNIPIPPPITNTVPKAPEIPSSNIPIPPPIPNTNNNIPVVPSIPNPPVIPTMAPVKGGPNIPLPPPIPPLVMNPPKPKVEPPKPKPKPKPVEEDFGSMLRRQVLARGKKVEGGDKSNNEKVEINEKEEENLEDILKKKIANSNFNNVNNDNNINNQNNENKIQVNVPFTKESIKINAFMTNYDLDDDDDEEEVDSVFALKQNTMIGQNNNFNNMVVNSNQNIVNGGNNNKLMNTISFPQDNKIKVNDEKSKKLERAKTHLLKMFGDDDEEEEIDITSKTTKLNEQVNLFTGNKPKNEPQKTSLFDNPPKPKIEEPKIEDKKQNIDIKKNNTLNDFQQQLSLKMFTGGNLSSIKKDINKENENENHRETLKIEYTSDIKKVEGENNYEAIMKQETKVIKKKKPVKKGFGSNIKKSNTVVEPNSNLNTNQDNKNTIPKSETFIQNEDKKEVPIKENIVIPKKNLFTDENENKNIIKKENIINPKNNLFIDKNENTIFQNTIVPNKKINLFDGNNNNNNKLTATMTLKENPNTKKKLSFLYDDDE